jgi:hypothetical protein
VTTAFTAASWVNFALAATEASATLTGLLFFAVSINMRQILRFPHLVGRVAETLILFGTPLITGIFVVVPHSPRAFLAAELIATGIAVGSAQLLIAARSPRSDRETLLTRIVQRVLPPIVTCGCLAVAGATLAVQDGGGLYWLIPSVLAAIIFGLVNTWVLLVEILR